MSGMVVQAESDARQFHITYSNKLNRQVDFAVWVSGETASCSTCGGVAYPVIGGISNEFYREWRRKTISDNMVACPACNGHFIE